MICFLKLYELIMVIVYIVILYINELFYNLGKKIQGLYLDSLYEIVFDSLEY